MFASRRTDMPEMTKEQARSRRISLIGMYILGIAIGCVLVQLMLQVKRAMLQPQPPQQVPAQPGATAGSPASASPQPVTPR